jgi:uncharacterized protein YjbI with pentapeptide repeats
MANKEHASAKCKHYDFCGRDIEGNPTDGLCILHSTDPAKDTHAFAEALAEHRKREYGDYFINFVFPGRADFRDITFTRNADFSGATFNDRADFEDVQFLKRTSFHGVKFLGIANFSRAKFTWGANFQEAIFTEHADFRGTNISAAAYFWDALFNKRAIFAGATFTQESYFGRATFTEAAEFLEAAFGEAGDFHGAKFTKRANFFGATFTAEAGFIGTTFTEEADFSWAIFSRRTNFIDAMFLKRADFSEAGFIEANFSGATFNHGANFVGAGFTRTIIGSEREERLVKARYIFAGAKVDFRRVIINSPDVVTFIGADLTKCQFLDTDLRKMQLVDVKWPQKGRRLVVYDEIALAELEDETEELEDETEEEEEGSVRPWSQIERLYRELKQNYEDRRDYEHAGDFHYGEKEMRRQNPDTALGLRFFLALYWLFSGYGERYLRPLLWAGLLFVGSTIGYMWWGLRPKAGGSQLAWTNGWDWLQGAHYSFRVMTLLKPDDWVPVGYAHVINTFQTLLGPLSLGLFALALRQRLKR